MKRGDAQEGTVIEGTATGADSAAEQTSAPKVSSRAAQAEDLRAKAVQFMADKQYALARKALEEAESLDADPAGETSTGPRRVLAALRGRLSRKSESEAKDDAVVLMSTATVDKAVRIVDLYSKIAAVVGLLPGNILNFAAILAVMVTMVWRIGTTFGHRQGHNRIKGSIMALIGAVVPTGVGHGIAAVVTAIPAIIAGSVLYFLITPVLAYALTKAVGNTFVMHFESGGTLLDFDPRGFQEYFLKEFKEAGGQLKAAA